MLIRLRDFKGVVPRRSPRLLGPSDAQTASMTDLRSGELRPFSDRLKVNTPTKSGTIGSIYLWGADETVVNAKGTITAATQANPVNIQSVGHGRTSGDRVYIFGVGGQTELNDITYTITRVDDDNFTLDGIDGTLHTAYTSGGTWVLANGFWFHWSTSEASGGVDVAETPITGDDQDTVVFTGHGVPKLTYSPLATGSTDYPDATYTLGLPAPNTAPSVAVSGTGTGSPTSHSFVYTFLATYGNVQMEGPPSDPSSTVEIEDGEQADLTSLETAPAGSYNITHKNIYRLNPDDGRYHFVAQVTVATTSTSVTKATTDGDGLKTQAWEAPPTTGAGVVMHPAGFAVMFDGKDVYPSVLFQPHAYPTTYRKTYASEVIGLGIDGQSIIVLTKTEPHRLTGIDPAQLSSSRLGMEQSCASRRSIASLGEHGVVWASPEGLMSSRGVNLIEPWMTRKEWQALRPSSIHGYYWDGRYVFFYDNGTTQAGYIFDPDEQTLTALDFYATDGHSDPIHDDLYLLISGDIYRWNAADAADAWTWKSKKFRTDRPVAMNAMRVYADDYTSVQVKLYAGGSLQVTVSPTDDSVARFSAAGFKDDEFEIEVSGTGEVLEVLVGDSVSALAAEEAVS